MRRKDVADATKRLHDAVDKHGVDVVSWRALNHHITPKHTGRYVDEFAFRLNDGNCTRPTFDRLDSFVDGMALKRLTYAALIAKPEGN